MVLFSNNVFHAANASVCHTRILRVDPRTAVPPDVQLAPHTLQGRRYVCCGGTYAHWLSCRDRCAKGHNGHNGHNRPSLQRASWSYVTADVLVAMRNVTIDQNMNKHGLCGPITADHRCVLNAMHWDSQKACELVMTRRIASRIPTLGAVSTVYSGTVGHFPQETVPTLLRMIYALPKHVPLLIPKTKIARRYAAYICSALGVNPARFVRLRGPILVGKLYLYRPVPRYSGDPRKRPLTVRSYDDFRLMRYALRPSTTRQQPVADKILLIRRKKSSRSLTNEAEVAAALRRLADARGLRFEVRDLGLGPLADDASTFQSARLVVGVHGAGLANIVFCSDNASLVEIGYTHGMPMPEIYFDQARFLGIRYWAMVGNGDYSGSVTVDVPVLVATCGAALARHTRALSKVSPPKKYALGDVL